jgi:hypothetical protein
VSLQSLVVVGLCREVGYYVVWLCVEASTVLRSVAANFFGRSEIVAASIVAYLRCLVMAAVLLRIYETVV